MSLCKNSVKALHLKNCGLLRLNLMCAVRTHDNVNNDSHVSI